MPQVIDHETDTVPEDWTADEEMPRRPRRRKLTPVTGSLVAIILAAGGFAGGVSVQKNRGTTTSAAGPGAGGSGQAPAGFTGGPPGAAGGTGTASDATTGTVTYAKGNTIYVKDSSGNTVKVKIKSSADVTRTAVTDSDKIEPGDTVTVTGAANSKGTVTATGVTAQEAGN